MPTTTQIDVKSLILDLKNFRTVPQKKESDAIKAMIAIKPDRFFAVIESIIDDGYLPTENIIVLNDGKNFIVKEGNRRIAALKLIHQKYKPETFNLPASILEKIKAVNASWKRDNAKVPCTLFSKKEEAKADRVVTLTHGKGEKASRDPWNSVARARHNRDVQGISEHGLDLLEKYLKKGSNLNNQQKERWSGEFPLSILDDALRRVAPRLNYGTVAELAQKYPKIQKLSELENIILNIGLEQIKFETMRSTDFLTEYGIPAPTAQATTGTITVTTSSNQASTTSSGNNQSLLNTAGNQTSTAQNPSAGTTSSSQAAQTSATAAPRAVAANDPKHAANLLRKFSPRGNNRQKVVMLRDEIKKLKINQNPLAFCFLLRSMFEISAKAYSADKGLRTTSSNGKDKTLVEMLRGVTGELTSNNANQAMVRVLHGAMAEIAKSDGLLSVTSMNQLVHNPSFSIAPPDTCILFGNIYPLLEAMN
jgi:hypothetical protein